MKAEALDLAALSQATRPSRSGPDHCPTTTELHRADDGLIARLRLPGGRMTPAQARVIADVAMPGDSIELTSRANLQVRGLTAHAAAAATEAFVTAGLTPSAAHDRARTIAASPFLGRLAGSGIDDAFIEALDAAIRGLDATRAVSGRVLTVVDDGTGHALAGTADILIAWDATARAARLAVGGIDAGVVALAGAPQAAAALLGRLADACTAAGVWRARELSAEARTALAAGSCSATGVAPSAHHQQRALPLVAVGSEFPIGVVAQSDGRAAVRVVASLGRLTAAQLAGAARLAERGGTDLRIDDRRGLTLVDLAPASLAANGVEASALAAGASPDAATALGALAELGLVTDPASPAVGLTACAGAACTRTEVDVRAAARLRATERRPGDGREHLVGCARRCGAPRGGMTVVAEPGDSAASLAARAADALGRIPVPESAPRFGVVALGADAATTASSPTGREAAR